MRLPANLRAFPRAPVCNCRADRAPRLGRYSFPLCWRCTAIITGMLIPLVLPPWLAVLFMLPCLIDGIAQYHAGIESTNGRRILTGLPAGIGIAAIVHTIVPW